KPIAGQRPWEKDSRAGRSFWLLPQVGHRSEVFRKGRVKEAEAQRPLLFWRLFRKALQRFPRQTRHRPFAHRYRTQIPVESYRRFIPIQNRPFEPGALSLARDLG